MTVPAVGYPGLAQRDRVADVLCFLLAVMFTVLVVVDGVGGHLPAGPLAADTVLGGLSCLGVWLRRRWPIGFAVIVGLFGMYSISAAGVALIALFTVAVYRGLAVVVPIAAGLALISLLTPLVRPDLPRANGAQVLLGFACVAAALAWGLFIRARRQLAASRWERARRAESEQQMRVAQARQLERNRIAREMHDVLAHRISLVSLHAGALELRPDAPPAEIARAAGVIRESAHRALDDLREVIGVLRAAPSSEVPERPQPTLADVPGLVDESRRGGTSVGFDCHVADSAVVPAAVGRTVYRIVQEGLTNARKHAPGAEVGVTVQGTAGDGLTVEIRNPAPAGAAAAKVGAIPGAGTGIIGLTERASLAGGRLEHGRTPTGDFRLWVWLPWPT